jgi:hypothetical protein
MKRNLNPILMCAFVGLSIVLAGCQKDETTVVKAAPPPPGGTPTGSGKPVGGSVINTSVMPAPPGVKTGLEGGKKD